MRLKILIALVAVIPLPALAATNSASVIAATATSSSTQAASVNCLLKSDCPGSWSPGSADSGANEGVYVQFETAVDSDTVELLTNVKDVKAPFTVSVNGALVPRSLSAKSSAENGAGRYAARYAIPGSRIKSMFFRLGIEKGGWQNFSLYAIRFYKQGKGIDLALPLLVASSVTASSVLEPSVAYQAANLFDSRYDFAWSTNGKTTSGKGESFEVRFNQPQNISGLMVWNGYQRSEEHFKANGRVARASVSEGPVSNSFQLSDRMGSQKVTLSNPLKSVSSLKFTIEGITPGAKYPDVLISELRFIDDHGQILVPQVKGIVPEGNSLTNALIDRSLSSVVCSSSRAPGNFQRSLRLRGDGSFVIYGKAYEDETSKKTDQVLEGNWELRGDQIRIFGKRYTDTVVLTEYSQNAHKTPPSIFQSDLKIARFHDLTPGEKQQLAALIWTRVSGATKASSGNPAEIRGVRDDVLAKGSDEKAIVTSLVKSLDNMNPWTVSSPILADAMLPSDDVGSCGTSF
jgi:hypothetical protein